MINSEDKIWLIWSIEHSSFWNPNHRGYTVDINKAGRYSLSEAIDICKNANYPSDEYGYYKETPKIFNISVNEVMCPSPEFIEEIKKNGRSK